MVTTNGLSLSHMCTVNSTFDLGARLSLLRYDKVKSNKMSAVDVSKQLQLGSAAYQKIEFFDTMILHIRMKEIHGRVLFGSAKNSAIYILLGTIVVDKPVKEITRAERKLVRYSSQSVAISTLQKASDDNQTTTGTTNVTDSNVTLVEPKDEAYVMRVAYDATP